MPVTWKAGSSVIQLHKGTEKILKSKLGTLILPILGITATSSCNSIVLYFPHSWLPAPLAYSVCRDTNVFEIQNIYRWQLHKHAHKYYI